MDWKLTRDAAGQPAIDEIHHDPDEDNACRFSLLAFMAEDPENHMEQLAPGVYYQSKLTQP